MSKKEIMKEYTAFHTKPKAEDFLRSWKSGQLFNPSYQKYKEKYKLENKKYYEANKETMIQQHRQYKEANKDKIKQYFKERYQKNKTCKEFKVYVKNNREKRKAYMKKYNKKCWQNNRARKIDLEMEQMKKLYKYLRNGLYNHMKEFIEHMKNK